MTEWIDYCSGCFKRLLVNKETGRCNSCQLEWQEFRRKDEMNSLKNEIASHLHKIQEHMDCGETRYAFHEADTIAVKLRQLCDIEATD